MLWDTRSGFHSTPVHSQPQSLEPKAAVAAGFKGKRRDNNDVMLAEAAPALQAMFCLSFIGCGHVWIPTIRAAVDDKLITCLSKAGLYRAAHGRASWHGPSQGQGDKRGGAYLSMPGYISPAAVREMGKNGPAVLVLREAAGHRLCPDSQCPQPTGWLFASDLFSPVPPATQIQLQLESNTPSHWLCSQTLSSWPVPPPSLSSGLSCSVPPGSGWSPGWLRWGSLQHKRRLHGGCSVLAPSLAIGSLADGDRTVTLRCSKSFNYSFPTAFEEANSPKLTRKTPLHCPKWSWCPAAAMPLERGLSVLPSPFLFFFSSSTGKGSLGVPG